METYYGRVRSSQDARILFEACSMGLLSCVTRCLSTEEQLSIRPGSVFVWDEHKADIQIWVDGRQWIPCEDSASPEAYREINHGNIPKGKDRHDCYQPDGLIRQHFGIILPTGQNLQMISYYSESDSFDLQTPWEEPSL
ncbi:hypothetical protein BO70DRAFT_258621, partial [Aspergillus heteromorphus CBS 117.55]